MKDRMTRRETLKSLGLLTAGSAALGLAGAEALSLGRPSIARAQLTQTQVFAEGYVDLGGQFLLVQATATNVPIAASLQTLASPGRGFDLDFASAVVKDNRDATKGRDPSWCLITYAKGALTAIPPQNIGGVDAIRLEGPVIDSATGDFIGATVKFSVASSLPIDGHHNICLIKFDFAGFVFTGFGLVMVNL